MDEILRQLLMGQDIQNRRFEFPPPPGREGLPPNVDLLNPWDSIPDDWTKLDYRHPSGLTAVTRTLESASPRELRARGITPEMSSPPPLNFMPMSGHGNWPRDVYDDPVGLQMRHNTTVAQLPPMNLGQLLNVNPGAFAAMLAAQPPGRIEDRRIGPPEEVPSGATTSRKFGVWPPRMQPLGSLDPEEDPMSMALGIGGMDRFARPDPRISRILQTIKQVR